MLSEMDDSENLYDIGAELIIGGVQCCLDLAAQRECGDDYVSVQQLAPH